MSPRDIASLAFKLAGVCAIIQAIALLPPLLSLPAWDLSQSLDPKINVSLLLLGQLVPIVMLIGLGLLLYLGSRSLARSTVGKAVDGREPIQPSQIHAILFSVVGALLIGLSSKSVPYIFQNLAVLLSDYGTEGYRERRMDLISENWQWASGVCLQLLIGVGLLLWGKRVAAIYYRSATPAEAIKKSQRCPHCDQPFFPDDYRSDSSTRLCSNCHQELPSELFKPGV